MHQLRALRSVGQKLRRFILTIYFRPWLSRPLAYLQQSLPTVSGRGLSQSEQVNCRLATSSSSSKSLHGSGQTTYFFGCEHGRRGGYIQRNVTPVNHKASLSTSGKATQNVILEPFDFKKMIFPPLLKFDGSVCPTCDCKITKAQAINWR